MKILCRVLLLPTLSLVGCVLPVPNKTVYQEGYQGRVVEGLTARPVSGARVSIHRSSSWSNGSGGEYFQEETTTTTPSGFMFAEDAKWHWGYLIGPVSYPLPYDGMRLKTSISRVEVRADGYAPYVWIKGSRERQNKPPKEIRLQRSPEYSAGEVN
ncbi:hypothetical protein SAMN02745181_2475 [Rubritalea squalenifaciens DSM 18772]|uniref:Lipoprotein n=1 Tax=Rubritalea squalenifaciens DSM 18772 TaxID=1123071 RepID=A0A1M6LQV2_9BACT|nr:hypothetical protein [Rubritalea squalenifaciens]SHJ73565.1 hypothetical protein SAMN02745181_2475 [Rubritalea squalenifaciens DSM 18772]